MLSIECLYFALLVIHILHPFLKVVKLRHQALLDVQSGLKVMARMTYMKLKFIFSGTGNCYECNQPLRRGNFKEQLFDDSNVEKEVEIRKKLLKEYNKVRNRGLCIVTFLVHFESFFLKI